MGIQFTVENIVQLVLKESKYQLCTIFIFNTEKN